MHELNREAYLEERLQDQIDWYDRKALQSQKRFKLLQLAAILASATIPFLTGFISETTVLLKLAVGGLGLVITAITAVLGLYKFQENWLQYRSTCEALKREKYLYLAKSEPYDAADPFQLLVASVEGLIAEENKAWHRYMKKANGAMGVDHD